MDSHVLLLWIEVSGFGKWSTHLNCRARAKGLDYQSHALRPACNAHTNRSGPAQAMIRLALTRSEAPPPRRATVARRPNPAARRTGRVRRHAAGRDRPWFARSGHFTLCFEGAITG